MHATFADWSPDFTWTDTLKLLYVEFGGDGI